MLYSAYISFLNEPNACEPEMFREIVSVDVDDAENIDVAIEDAVAKMALAPAFSVIAIKEGLAFSPDDFFDEDADVEETNEDAPYEPDEPDPDEQAAAWEDYLEATFPTEMS